MRHIGLHVRIIQSILEAAYKADYLRMPLFQCFLFLQRERCPLLVTNAEIKEFIAFVKSRFDMLYLHGSYGINLASTTNKKHTIFERELRLAQRLEFTHFVLHPGCAKGAHDKIMGIDALARHLNKWLRQEQDIVFVLENMAHDGMTIGGDLYDFKQLCEKLERPERVKFCIDTAHAYAFGYDISQQTGLQQFVSLLDTTVGIENIALIHLNDTTELLGSKQDRHTLLGQGNIGLPALKRFVMHKQLINIPLIMELPLLEIEQENALLKTVKGWHTLR